MAEEVVIPLEDPLDEWFELSYAQYLTIPRSVLQSMPAEWKERFAKCLTQLDEMIDWRPSEGRYWVELRDGKGRIARDPFKEYRHAPPVPFRENKS